jgi:hypothetical protein
VTSRNFEAEKVFRQEYSLYSLGGFMALEIVWRNPIPPAKTDTRVEPVVVDEFGALYLINSVDSTTAFQVILGGAA